MSNKKKFIAYGSLKQNQYNFFRFSPGLEYIEDITLSGFKMISLGSYPAVVKTDDIADTIHAEILEADDRTYESIKMMETGAGYEMDLVWKEEEPLPIFVMKQERIESIFNKPLDELQHINNWNKNGN